MANSRVPASYSAKPVVIELGLELLAEVLLFLYPYGAEQMNLPHNFWLGLGCWIVGAAIAVRMFWIFPLWGQRLTPLEKGLISFICVGLFGMAVYKPVAEAYGKRNEKVTSTASVPPPVISPTGIPAPQPELPTHIEPKNAHEPKKPAKPEEPTPIQTQPAATISPGSIVQQGNSGGISVQQGTTGPNSPIIDSPITVGSIPRKISPKDMRNIIQLLAKAPTKATVDIFADQYSGAQPLPDDFYQALKDAGWDMKYAGVSRGTAYSLPGDKFQGAFVTIKGEPLGPGETLTTSPYDPLSFIGAVLQALKIPHILIRSRTAEEGVISIQFFGGFPD